MPGGNNELNYNHLKLRHTIGDDNIFGSSDGIKKNQEGLPWSSSG